MEGNVKCVSEPAGVHGHGQTSTGPVVTVGQGDSADGTCCPTEDKAKGA